MSLELHDVTIAVAGRALLRGLTARVEPGQVLAVMGPSGSGKSSLLAWIAGTLEAPFSGRGDVRLEGHSLAALPIQRRRVGLLFQDDLLFPHMSVRDNLLFALPARQGSARGSAAGDRRARIDAAEAALGEAGLAGFGQRVPVILSGGRRARVSLLRALLARPRALLLDEPFSKLDTALRAQMREFTFSTLRERGVPTVLVTHDEADVPPAAQVVRLAA